jgi:hypothetical protein
MIPNISSDAADVDCSSEVTDIFTHLTTLLLVTDHQELIFDLELRGLLAISTDLSDGIQLL